MATYYIYRKDIPGTMSPLILDHKAKAFRTLYCGNPAPKLEIIIKGEWPDAFGGEGLYLKHNQGAKVVKIGRKFVTLEYNDMGKIEQVQVELTPGRDKGFSEIMFITMNGAQ